ncbi:MAG TPA: hypothetical protein VGR55_05680 [Candidatus Acidoferrum sp.]|nr:hypothetical protein [Candidatus Acidoferrum sp.]
MNQQSTTASPANGAATAQDLFVLTDEQILEIEPEGADTAPVGQPFLAVPAQSEEIVDAKLSPDPSRSAASESATQTNQQNAQAGMPVPPEPPPWLAAQMKDPWSGEEAKEFWNGVQQARQEAAAYRAAFATPEDARALKELYPGGVNEAREAANRARLLDEIDRSFFGATGATPEQTSAARAQLAGMMLREDPAAFREMVFAGLRALDEAEKGSGTPADAPDLPRLAQVFAANRSDARSAVGATLASPTADDGASSTGGASAASPVSPRPLAASAASGASSLVGTQHTAPPLGNGSTSEAHVAAYATFEKAANEDLERSVGAAITHTIQQALPNLGKDEGRATEGARHSVPLQERLGAAVRQDVEAALKGDRQLGEQIAQILSARRFDNETRAQVVRLIDDRARQLVPSAARRVINDWTQTTLAAHRGNASRSDAANARRAVEPATAQGPMHHGLPAAQAGASPTAFSSQAAQTRPGAEPRRNASRSDARRLDYRKLSDEQILEL